MSDIEKAAEQVTGPARLIEASAGEFAKVLPAHITPEKYTRWGLTVIRKGLTDGKAGEAWGRVLASEAGRLSVLAALMDCASLGLEPGRTYHLVPFGDQVTGITDYKGEIELITRANPRAAVVAGLVHAKDNFTMLGANIPPRHEADWFGDRGPVAGGYAYVQLAPDVYSMVVLMDEAEFLRHRDKARTKTVWDEWPEAMRCKTLVHELRKFVAWSAEWRGWQGSL